MEKIITAVTDPCTAANDDFARVMGVPKKKPTYYVHKQDGSKYSHIQGALSWPVSGPGCAIVVGITREEDPGYMVFEAAFSDHPRDFLDCCCDLKEKYTPTDHPKLLQPWLGENMFEALLVEVNKGQKFPIYLFPPTDIEKPNSDKIFIEKIWSLAEAGKISIAPQKVADELNAMTKIDAERPLTSYPAAAAVGYVLHYLSINKPWLTSAGSPKNCDSF